MSTWHAAQVAQWVQAAGWKGDDITTATALAMAASGGDDHHTSNPSWVPALERRGLFALRACEAPALSPGELYDPVRNAKAAWAFWRDMGGTWAWHPVWVSGEAGRELEAVRAVLSSRRRPAVSGAPVTFAKLLDYASRFQTAMAQQRRS